MSSAPCPSASPVDAGLRRAVARTRARAWSEGPPVGRMQVREPEVGVVLTGPWSHAESALSRERAARFARRVAARKRLRAALEVPVTSESVPGLVADLVALQDAADAGVLGPADLLARLRLADRVASWAAAHASAALADYAGPAGPDDAVGELAQAQVRRDRHLRLEVRVARGISDDAAGRDIDAARRLAADLAPVRAAWSRGEVSSRHVAVVLDRTRLCGADLTAAVLDRVGARLVSTSANRIGAVITAALAGLDPAGQADRARTARRHDVGVHYRGLPDGLAQIVATHRVEDARAIMELVDDTADRLLAHRRDCDPCAAALPDEIGPARAAAHLALVLREDADGTAPTAAVDTDGCAGRSGHAAGTATVVRTPSRGRGRRRGSRRGELQVVVDLATLLGLAEEPGLLASQPVPAAIARELAGECGSLRRIVTDPVTGHLLDYGTRVYLPDSLKEFVSARDGTCRSPGCGQPAARSQLDHVIAFPHGPSDVANTHALCKRDHDTKTDGDLDVLDHRADGSATWRTRHGQTGVTPPRPYLPGTGIGPPPDDDPCPF
ncbi:MAG: DUF222 domain-containing protein [Actinomycetales bacterium]|nr:DUF222 domain-containing protein [Actinomycetales bacterium]